jgi:peptidoglycan hydrolase-like protein with peptidoglycan-binding domain
MSDDDWTKFNGICGHQHVPGNSHWDPGAMDIKGLVALIKNGTGGSGGGGTQDPDTPDWPMLLEEGDRHERVRVVRGVLQALGFGTLTQSEFYNAEVADAVRTLQRAEKIEIDGIWGPTTHSHAIMRIQAELEREPQD